MCLAESKIEEFLSKTDDALANISAEPIYYVDYIYNGTDINSNDILVIANAKSLWGKDVNEPSVAIEKLKITKNMINVYKKATNTLKITLPNNIALIKFNASEEECEKLENHNEVYLQLNIVGKCAFNEWMGNITPQIHIEDYEIVDSGRYLF